MSPGFSKILFIPSVEFNITPSEQAFSSAPTGNILIRLTANIPPTAALKSFFNLLIVLSSYF